MLGWISLIYGFFAFCRLAAAAPTPEEIGIAGWTILHTVTIAYPENPTFDQKNNMLIFFQYFAKVYPCAVCSQHFQMEIAQDPPRTESRDELTQWLCRIHNRVNVRLGKPEFDCANLYKRWDPRSNHIS